MNSVDLIAERFRALDERARATLACAALLGYRPDFALLVACVDEDPAATLDALEAASDLDLVVRVAWDPPAYRFRHALIRDAVRKTLDPEAARAVHRVIAAKIETLADASGRLEEIAYHWSRAGDTARSAAYRARAVQDAGRLGV